MMTAKDLIPQIKIPTSAVKPIFVLSHGRAGTKWLAAAVQAMCPGTIAVHEPAPMIKGLALEYHYGNVSNVDAVEAIMKARGQHIYAAAKYYKAKAYVEVNRNLFSLAGPLRRAFPQCKVVGLVRDGRKFLVSMLNKDFYNEHPKIRGKGGGKPYLESKEEWWKDASQVEKISWHWVEKINAFKNEVGLLFKSETIWTYEGFKDFTMITKIPFCNNPIVFEQISCHKVNRGDNYKVRSFNELSLEDQGRFWMIAGKTMRELGYGQS